jgi:tetratricopeptide (TPR) repeat protein
MNLGWLHAERGQYERALVDLSTAAQKITPGTSPYNRKTIYANWANALAKTNQLAAAREKYALALDVEPNGLDLLRDAARVDLQLGDPARAIERLHQALEVDPKDADAAYLLASATELQGGESGVLFARAQALAPRRAVVTVELARTLARQGKLQEAHGLLERILALTPAADARDAQFVTSTVHAHLGEILLERGDVAGGVAELERALAIWPENYDANNRLAFLLATSTDPALHDPARAVVLAERASAERREYGSLSTLAVAYAAAGRVPAAVETARQGLELATRASDPYAIAALEHQLSVYARLPGTVSDPTRP